MREIEGLRWPEFSQKPAFKVVSRSGATSVALHRGSISETTRTVGIISKWPVGADTSSIINYVAPGFKFDTPQIQLAFVGGPDDEPDGNIKNLNKADHYKPLLVKAGYIVESFWPAGEEGRNKEITVVTSPTVAAANKFAESVFGDDYVKLKVVPGRYTALEFLTEFVENDTVLVAEATDGENLVWQLHDDAALQKLVWLGVYRELRDELKERIRPHLDKYKEELANSALVNIGDSQPKSSLPILQFIMARMHDFGDSLAQVLIEGVGQDDLGGAMYSLNSKTDPDMAPGVREGFTLSGDQDKWLGDGDRIQERFEKARKYAESMA